MRPPRTTDLPIVALLWGCLSAGGFLRAQDEEGDPGETLLDLVEKAVAQAPQGTFLDSVDVKALNREGKALVAKMRTRRVTLSLKKVRLGKAVELLRKIADVNLIVSPKALAKFKKEEPEVTVDLKDVRLVEFMDHLIRQAKGFGITVRHGALYVGLEEEVKPRPILVIYDVTDLLRRPRDFPAPKLGLSDRKPEDSW